MQINVIILIIILQIYEASGLIREYYLAAVEQEWDYAPSGHDLVFNHQAEANLRIKTQKDRIGSKYTKAVYKQYTDFSYRQEIVKPPHQGYVGPTLKGELGDTIRVHFRNALTQINISLSVHPHGLFYPKSDEGALYLDGENPRTKIGDAVWQGQSHTYEWTITENYSPTEDDDNCIPWGYHSHVDSMTDIETGLVGILLTCKRGVLNRFGQRLDVDKEIVLYTDETDESKSHFIHSNLLRCYDPRDCMQLLRKKDKAFMESNKMYHINGYVYGNLPDLNVCAAENVALYVFALANGIHSMQIFGQTFIIKNHRTDSASIYPATFVTANTVPINIGTWLLVCRNNAHLHDGMTAFYNVKRCNVPLQDTPIGTMRTFYIAAEEVYWNYMPGGQNLFAVGKVDHDHGFSSNPHHHAHHGDHHDSVGHTYKKAVFVEYEDPNFRQMKARPDYEEHLHMLGPPIKVEVGDSVQIVFKNKASRAYSFFPHGVGFDKSQEGSVYFTANHEGPYGRITKPNETEHYHFNVPWTVAPTDTDPNCLSYTYHSAADLRKDTNTGLVGPLLVCKPGSLNGEQRQRYVNREIFVLFHVVDENLSWYINDSIMEFAPDKKNMDKNDENFQHANLIHAINGRIYATLDGIDMCLGDRVSWHFMGLGASKDLHGIALSGNSMAINGRTVDASIIIPGIGFTAYMHPDNVGKWALYCHTHHHLMAGMSAMYNVNVCQKPQSLPVLPMLPSGGKRVYYIAAVEIEWNYAPSGVDRITGKSLSDTTSHGYLYTRSDGGYLGTVYKKAVYREFTDETFRYEKTRGYEEIHLGLLGPFIRANVGDLIEVVFKNKASYPFSIKPHGAFANKGNEGMKYNDKSAHSSDNAVQPGKVFTYRWTVPQRAGPGPNEPNCVGWVYHSATDMIRDIPTGLMGPLITCRRGILDDYNKRKDSNNREFAVVWYIINENRSWYIRENMQRVRQTAPHVPFEESNQMNSINGYVFGNTPGMVMEVNENITWYVIGLGSEPDYHTVHFHGQTYLHKTSQTHRGDVVEVFPGTYETVYMLTDNPGTWLLHCHVMDHLTHGMEAKYAIVPKGALQPLEDAEKNKTRIKYFHKLPVVVGSQNKPIKKLPSTGGNSQRQPPKQSTVLIIPPSARADSPILARNLNRLPNQQLSNSPPIAAARENNQHVLANPELLDLHRNGILPGQWQIQTRPNRNSRNNPGGSQK